MQWDEQKANLWVEGKWKVGWEGLHSHRTGGNQGIHRGNLGSWRVANEPRWFTLRLPPQWAKSYAERRSKKGVFGPTHSMTQPVRGQRVQGRVGGEEELLMQVELKSSACRWIKLPFCEKAENNRAIRLFKEKMMAAPCMAAWALNNLQIFDAT